MKGNGQDDPTWAIAVEGKPSLMLQVALTAVCRNGGQPRVLPECNGDLCRWVRQVAEGVGRGPCRAVAVFCHDAGLASCIANKVAGVRAAAVATVAQGARALDQLGANVLVIEMAGRTYFECKEMLRLCCRGTAVCPDQVACVLQELDGHAHR
jgi:hypothetical protein